MSKFQVPADLIKDAVEHRQNEKSATTGATSGCAVDSGCARPHSEDSLKPHWTMVMMLMMISEMHLKPTVIQQLPCQNLTIVPSVQLWNARYGRIPEGDLGLCCGEIAFFSELLTCLYIHT